MCRKQKDTRERTKYKFGYVISHEEGSTQAHLETRDGDMALGRYYVNLPNGSGQKVTYLADDVGYHTGVSYNSKSNTGSSKTHIAMGHKAIASLSNFDVPNTHSPLVANTVTPIVTKIAKGLVSTVTQAPVIFTNPDQTVTKGFYIVKESTDSPKTVTNKFDSLSSSSLSTTSKIYQSTNSKQNLKLPTVTQKPNEEQDELGVMEVRKYLTVAEPSPHFYENSNKKLNLDKIHRVNNESYVAEKSIEKTLFTDVDAQIISNIQKHAEGIIMKDLKKEGGRNLKLKISTNAQTSVTPKAITMQPIIVPEQKNTKIHNNNNNNNNFRPRFSSQLQKLTKNIHPASINALKINDNKNNNELFLLEKSSSPDTSSSPSGTSFINVSKVPHQLIDAKSTNRNLNSNNSTHCESNLCDQDNNRAFSDNLVFIKPEKDITLNSDANTNKFTHTFYPQNHLKEERHYVTTIDVQKGIAIDVQQNEDGSIHLASNFPFKKLQNYHRQYSNPQSVLNSVTPVPILKVTSTPTKTFFSTTPKLKTYTTIKTGLHSPVLNRIPSKIYHHALEKSPKENVKILESNFPEVKNLETMIKLHESISTNQEIFPNEKRKNSVDEERREYFENLKKVEEVKRQNSKPFLPHPLQSNIIIKSTTEFPASSVEVNSVETPAGGNSVKFGQIQINPEVTPLYTNYVTEIPVLITSKAHFPPNENENEKTKQQQEEISKIGSLTNYFDGTSLRNVFVETPAQSTSSNQNQEKSDSLTNAVQINPLSVEPQFTPPEAEEKIEHVQPLALTQGQLNAFHLNLQPSFQTRQKGLLMSPLVTLDYAKPFRIEQPLSLINTVPVQIPAGTEQKPVTAVYQFPQAYHLPSPIQILQPSEHVGNYVNIPKNNFQIKLPPRVTNKLRVQPLKPSPPDEETQGVSNQTPSSQPQFQQQTSLPPQTQTHFQQQPLQSSLFQYQQQTLLPQSQFHQPPAYFFPNYLGSNLQLRSIGRKKIPKSDQPTAQSLVRLGKSLNNLKIEYGFKPPLRPSVEFSEEVKPSVYGPSVPQK